MTWVFSSFKTPQPRALSLWVGLLSSALGLGLLSPSANSANLAVVHPSVCVIHESHSSESESDTRDEENEQRSEVQSGTDPQRLKRRTIYFSIRFQPRRVAVRLNQTPSVRAQIPERSLPVGHSWSNGLSAPLLI